MEHRAGQDGSQVLTGDGFQGDVSDACEDFASRRGAGYMTQEEMYRMGAITTAFNLIVFLAVGTPWTLFDTR
jgi:hypothetical protein